MISKIRSEATQAPSSQRARTSVLLVDDDPGVLKMTRRVLERAGHDVVACSSGEEALLALEGQAFDAMLSDVRMPGVTGMDLLRAVRERDLDIPVLLMTADPALDSATAAVEYGVFQYLTKPVPNEQLQGAVDRAATLGQLARLKLQCMEEATSGVFRVGDRAGADATIARALAGLSMAFQPVLHSRTQQLFAYEAFLRSGDLSPATILRAAERTGRLPDLGQRARAKIAEAMANAPDEQWSFFVNAHPNDLLDNELYAPHAPLSAVASRVVLEVSERSELAGIPGLRERVRELRKLGYRIGLDDVGAGYFGLNTFVSIEPEFVKLDMSLVRDLDRDQAKRKIVSTLASLCHEMEAQIIAEGVETKEELSALQSLGCDFVQGHFFAHPGPGFPRVT
jgi:EAL domain-containing protein (putative c-di-GMP-specific phosphodiesterase class I)